MVVQTKKPTFEELTRPSFEEIVSPRFDVPTIADPNEPPKGVALDDMPQKAKVNYIKSFVEGNRRRLPVNFTTVSNG